MTRICGSDPIPAAEVARAYLTPVCAEIAELKNARARTSAGLSFEAFAGGRLLTGGQIDKPSRK